MIGPSGWFNWATLEKAPQDRLDFYGTKTPVDLLVHHSYEGWYANYKVQYVPERYPTAPHGVVLESGEFIQIAPYNAATVHGHMANLRGPGIEADGTNAKLLTQAQIDTFRRIHGELEQITSRKVQRWTGSGSPATKDGILWLVEHKQMGPTACPSNRYQELWEILEQEEDQEVLDKEKLEAVYRALCAGDASVLKAWNDKGNSLLLGYAGEQLEQDRLTIHKHDEKGNVTYA